MADLNQMELQNLRHLIGAHENAYQKLNTYSSQAVDPQIKQLFATYEQSKVLVAEHTYMQQSFATLQNMFEDKRNKPDANIMVYGVYNAGKSTLINAIP